MYDLSDKAVQRALLTDENFIAFAHEYFMKHAPDYVVYEHFTSPDCNNEFSWVRSHLREVSTAYHAYRQSTITTASDTTASTSGAASTPPATSKTSEPTVSASRQRTAWTPPATPKNPEPTDGPSDGDLKPAARAGLSDAANKPAGEKRKSPLISGPETVAIEDDDQESDPTPNSAKKPKKPSDLAELVGAELMGSPAFRKALQKYVVDEVVTDALSRSPARAAGSVPIPSISTTLPIPRPQDTWGRPEDNPRRIFDLRSRSNAQKAKAARKQACVDAKADLVHMIAEFLRKGRDPSDRQALLHLARRYFLDQMDRRRHPQKIDIIKEALSTMLIIHFQIPDSFSEMELSFITGPPCANDGFIPEYAPRKPKGGRVTKSDE